MQSAVPVGEGGMTVLIGAEIEQAEEVAKESAATGGVCVVANDNAPGQVVLSGTLDALGRAAEIAKAKGIKRALAAGGIRAPFHCPLLMRSLPPTAWPRLWPPSPSARCPCRCWPM